jgi:3-hydroxyisobutyrate dehydrogenase-like beta-hydroxyacid dehydrogenase
LPAANIRATAPATEAKLDLALPQAVKSLYDRAIAAGHGGSTWSSLYEVIVP